MAKPVDQIMAELKPLGLSRQRANRIYDASKYINDAGFRRILGNPNEITNIPGVGEYIGNAYNCFALGMECYILDTNVARIVYRLRGIKPFKRPEKDKLLKEEVKSILHKANAKDFNYALLDLGAIVCLSRKIK